MCIRSLTDFKSASFLSHNIPSLLPIILGKLTAARLSTDPTPITKSQGHLPVEPPGIMALGIQTKCHRPTADLGDGTGEEQLQIVGPVGVVVVEVDEVAVCGGGDGLQAVLEGDGHVGVEVFVLVVGVEGYGGRGQGCFCSGKDLGGIPRDQLSQLDGKGGDNTVPSRGGRLESTKRKLTSRLPMTISVASGGRARV